MKMTVAILVPADGNDPLVILEPKDKKEFKLEEMQAMAGGYIEIVNLGPELVMVADEEGLCKNSRVNPRASVLAGQTIVGNVAIFDRAHLH